MENGKLFLTLAASLVSSYRIETPKYKLKSPFSPFQQYII